MVMDQQGFLSLCENYNLDDPTTLISSMSVYWETKLEWRKSIVYSAWDINLSKLEYNDTLNWPLQTSLFGKFLTTLRSKVAKNHSKDDFSLWEARLGGLWGFVSLPKYVMNDLRWGI